MAHAQATNFIFLKGHGIETLKKISFSLKISHAKYERYFKFDHLKVHPHDIFRNFFVLNQNLIGPEALFEFNLTWISIFNSFCDD
jgi:hypothetical protein